MKFDKMADAQIHYYGQLRYSFSLIWEKSFNIWYQVVTRIKYHPTPTQHISVDKPHL